MEIKKHWLGKLDFLGISKKAEIHPRIDRIVIRRVWAFGEVSKKDLKISGLEEVEANKGAFWRQMLNFGTLTFRGQGVTESINFVKDPKFYENYLEEIRNGTA